MPRRIGHITVAAVGRLRGRHWRLAQDDYASRLAAYTDFALVEVKDAVGKALPNTTALAREAEQLMAATRGHRLVLLSEDGKQLRSPALATFLQRQLEQYGQLAFLIGGPLGVDATVAAAVHEQLSLSSLTFPHELARILLLEQLYRAFTILHGEPYHK